MAERNKPWSNFWRIRDSLWLSPRNREHSYVYMLRVLYQNLIIYFLLLESNYGINLPFLATIIWRVVIMLMTVEFSLMFWLWKTCSWIVLFPLNQEDKRVFCKIPHQISIEEDKKHINLWFWKCFRSLAQGGFSGDP